MTQALAIMSLIVQLLPILIAAIKAIEAAIPEKGNGEAKLSAVRAVVESAYDVSSEVLPKFEAAWPAIEKTISALVATFNATGQFKK